MSTANVIARIFALVLAFVALAALAAFARDGGQNPQGAAPACCIYLIF
jgi:hypothetical protein